MMTLQIGNEEIKLCNNDFSKILKKRWMIGYVGKNKVVYRLKKILGENLPVLLSQDIVGKLCEIKHIDGNTMNYRSKNIIGINVDKSFVYDVTIRPVIVNQNKTTTSINYSRADVLFEEIVTIADTPVEGTKIKETPKGTVIETGDMTDHRRLQIDARKWVVAKMQPKKYGDRLDVTSDGEKLSAPVIKIGYGAKEE